MYTQTRLPCRRTAQPVLCNNHAPCIAARYLVVALRAACLRRADADYVKARLQLYAAWLTLPVLGLSVLSAALSWQPPDSAARDG